MGRPSLRLEGDSVIAPFPGAGSLVLAAAGASD
jgi:hypothetical protein